MPWLIIAVLGTVLIGMVAQSGHRSPEASPGVVSQPSRTLPPPVEVRRALPVDTGVAAQYAPLRPVYTPDTQRQIGTQQMTTMPDGSTVPTTFKGYLSDVSQLPVHSGQTGDMWQIGNSLWVLTTVPNSSRVGWVDPSGDEPEVRRAQPVVGVQVRRGKMVVPRAELVRVPDN